VEHTFFAMDTFVTLRLARAAADGTPMDDGRMETLFSGCEQIVSRLESEVSRTIPQSDTSRFNSSTAGIRCEGEELPRVLSRALDAAKSTNGAFSPAMGALINLWNISGGGPVPPQDAVQDARSHCDYTRLSMNGSEITKTDGALQLDLGGIAKGYAVDCLLSYLQDEGVAYGLVSLGGNVGVFGEKADGTPYTVGITDPREPASLAGYLHIRSGTVAVSGDYERFFEENGVRYHHILDPRTGMPADSGLCSVAVWSEDGALADALSTALFVMGAEEALRYYDAHAGTFEAVLITGAGEILVTEGLRRTDGFVTAEK